MMLETYWFQKKGENVVSPTDLTLNLLAGSLNVQ